MVNFYDDMYDEFDGNDYEEIAEEIIDDINEFESALTNEDTEFWDSIELNIDSKKQGFTYGIKGLPQIPKSQLKPEIQTKRFIGYLKDIESGNKAKGEYARTMIVAELDALVKYILSSRFSTYRSQYGAELWSEGMLGIFEALDKYNPANSSPSIYFYQPILHNMQVFVSKNIDNMTRYYSSVLTQVKKTRNKLLLSGATDISAQKIADLLRLPLSTVREVLRQEMYQEAIPYDVENEGLFGGARESNPLDVVLENEEREMIMDALSQIEPDEKKIVELHIGLNDDIQLAYDKIGSLLHMPVSDVKNKYTRAMRILREYFKKMKLPEAQTNTGIFNGNMPITGIRKTSKSQFVFDGDEEIEIIDQYEPLTPKKAEFAFEGANNRTA